MIFLDTHVLVWLYQGDLSLFSPKLLAQFEESELLVSPICILELEYLYEVKKLRIQSRKLVDELKSKIDLKVASESLENIILLAIDQEWTRDPFDRILVSHAKLLNLPLVSKDKTILKHYPLATW